MIDEHVALLKAADLTDEERSTLFTEYSQLADRLTRDGFEGSTQQDVLRSLIYARTAPRDLESAAETLENLVADAELEAFVTAGLSTETPVRRSLSLLAYDRFLRARDSRLRTFFRQHRVDDRQLMVKATLTALYWRLTGKPVRSDRVLESI